MRGVRSNHSGAGNHGQLREVLLEVRIALLLDLTLVGLLITLVNLVHSRHAFRDPRKGGESHAVQVGVVAKVDEHLRKVARAQ